MKNATLSDHSQSNDAFSDLYLLSASALLLAFALVLGWYNLATLNLTPPHDPLTGLSVRVLFWIVAGLFLAAAAICLVARSHSIRILLVVWLAANFEGYQIGLLFTGSHALRSYSGSFSSIYGLPRPVLELLVQGGFLYLFTGGLWLRLWTRFKPRRLLNQKAASELLKTVCPACGGHIEFAAQNLGQEIPCPHCQKTITLHKPDLLKMACFFCHGHIEFPTHAIGTKMACPHCNMDITLKEPA